MIQGPPSESAENPAQQLSKAAPQMSVEAMPPALDEKKESPSADGYIQSEVPNLALSSDPLSSVMPPQQVYVSNLGPADLASLETQFHSLGMNDAQGMGQIGGDGEEGNSEEEPVKLFVGQVPKSMAEEDIFPTFDPFGPLKDVAIIRDKHTGLHRGCAFVTFWASADAERAQLSLHDKFTFPGARRPAQVKPAEPSVPENKLFIGMLSRKAGEEEVRELFEPFGEIREIYMIRNGDGSSKCAAFLRYVNREAAIQAIESLHNNIVMDGSARPLIVKFADNKHQRQQRHMRNVRRQELLAVMGGPAFPGYQVPPMGMPPPGAGPQFAMPPQYGATYGAGSAPHGHPPHPYMFPPQFAPQAYAYQNGHDARPPNPRPREGPAGANLFVYHLPHDLTDADLATAFNPFGNVISAKVYVDKFTGESKGFGFVSYDSVISAESAIEQMNGFQIGPKRLKVQHKRVHGHNGGMVQSPQSQPHLAPPGPIPGMSLPISNP